MIAVQINKYGDNEVLEVNPNAGKPVPGKGQVLVEAHAASINPVDLAIRAGYLQKMAPLPFPVTLGGDVAGIIVAVGVEVTGFKVGSEVYGQAILLNGGSGAWAEFVVANTKHIAIKPKTVSFADAASLPLAGVSTLQALVDQMKLRRGEKILIQGGAGGIGTLAIQLAKSFGAFVATTVSSADKEFVRSLGADQVIDYKTEQFTDLVKDFDAVFDTVGGEVTNNSFAVLKKGGQLVSMKSQPDPELAKKYEVAAIGQVTDVNTIQLQRLAGMVDSHKIIPQVAKVFPLAQIREAADFFETSHTRGKVALQIKG